MNLSHTVSKSIAILSLGALASIPANAQGFPFEHNQDAHFFPGNLVVSRSVYDNNPNNVKIGTSPSRLRRHHRRMLRRLRRSLQRHLSARLQ